MAKLARQAVADTLRTDADGDQWIELSARGKGESAEGQPESIVPVPFLNRFRTTGQISFHLLLAFSVRTPKQNAEPRNQQEGGNKVRRHLGRQQQWKGKDAAYSDRAPQEEEAQIGGKPRSRKERSCYVSVLGRANPQIQPEDGDRNRGCQKSRLLEQPS